MTPSLQPQPLPPAGVECALSMQRSTLYADLGLRGNRKAMFKRALNIDFEPEYVAFDGPDISWNYRSDSTFDRLLYGDEPIAIGVAAFVGAMGATSRLLGKVSRLLASPASRRRGDRADLLADLQAYWGARELQTTSLFTFWNVEHRLGEELARLASRAGLDGEVERGLPRFLRPAESSYSDLEKQQMARIGARFHGLADDPEALPPELARALEAHGDSFGFLLAPFALGSRPGVDALLARAEGIERRPANAGEFDLRVSGDPLGDCDPALRGLGRLAQEIAFWKTERIDTLAAADARIAPLYIEVAAILGLDVEDVFALTRSELEDSLRQGALAVERSALDQRRQRYCLILHGGSIEFFQPSDPSEADRGPGASAGDRLTGTATSPGVASGKAVVITDAATLVQNPAIGDRVAAGDILVTKMTRKEMDRVLERAAAWITDEGGRISHAAIMSREMRKPCVTGVQDATRRLRDGMFVTVDGSHGYVTVDRVP